MPNHSSFNVKSGKLLEYRGERKHFSIISNGDVIAEITSYYKEQVQTVTIPETIKAIGFFAFKDCAALERVVLQPGVEKLEMGCFWHCPNLKAVHFCKTLRHVDSDAFPIDHKVTIHVPYVAGLWSHLKKANWLIHKVPKDIYDKYSGILIGMKLAYKRAVNLVLHIKGDVCDLEFNHFPVDCQLVIEEDIPSASKLFQCSAISKVTIGKRVKYVNPAVFSGGSEYFEDTSVEEITVDMGNTNYKSIDGVLFNSKNELVRYPQMKLMDKNTYYVPEGTTAICDFAFSWAYGIEHIYVGPNVEIRCGSFSNVPKLDSVFRERTEA